MMAKHAAALQPAQVTHGIGAPPQDVVPPRRQRTVDPFDPATFDLGSDERDFAMLVTFAADCKERAETEEGASAAASWGNLALRVMREVITLRREILEARNPPEPNRRKSAAAANPFLDDDGSNEDDA